MQTRRGYSWAVTASVVLLVDAVLMAITAVVVFQESGFKEDPLRNLLHESALPFVVYLLWGLSTFGAAAAFIAMGLYGFRAPWFWRCLVLAAVLWLVFPPIHMLIGLISLILLIRCRKGFFDRTCETH